MMKKLGALCVCLLALAVYSNAQAISITTTLDTTPPVANPNFIASTGQQTGRISNNGVRSTCDGLKPSPGLAAATGARQYDAFQFTATTSGCIEVIFQATTVLGASARNGSGFVPANPTTNYLADPGSGTVQGRISFYFDVRVGEQFTVVVNELAVGGGIGVTYTLTVSPVRIQSTLTTLDTNAPPPAPQYSTAAGPQTQRLFRDSVVSNCTSVKPTPALTGVTTARQYHSYTYTASRTGCITVLIVSAATRLFSAAYGPDGFVPATPNLNYLADGGNSDHSVKYSFRVNAGDQFTVVVHEVEPGAGVGEQYVLRVSQAISQTQFDFDGDHRSDIGIFRPIGGGASEWWVNGSSTGQTFALQFGASTDKIVPADYTGDSKADIAFWRPATGEWFILRSEDFSFFSFPFGQSGDVPVPADYDADGKADPAVFRSSNGTWFISHSIGGPPRILMFGIPGDQPVVGQYDPDGRADIAIFRPGPREWWINRSSFGLLALQFGNTADKVVPTDFTGDWLTDIAVWRPSTGEWFIIRSENLSFYSFPFGTNGDIPAPADYDGDGISDPTVFRPSGQATWFIGRSETSTLIVPFGANGDRPIANAFVP